MLGVKTAGNGIWMTTLAVGLLFGTCARAAPAGRPDCRELEITGERLACYDAAFPPKTKKVTSVENASRPAFKDPFVAADAKTAAKLKNICRGC
jgi:hypothetical protein